MHGSQSTALAQEALTGMDATADADPSSWSIPREASPPASGFEWNVPDSHWSVGRPFRPVHPTTCRSSSSWSPCSSRSTAWTRTGSTPPGSRVVPAWPASSAAMPPAVFAAVAPVSGLRLPEPVPLDPAGAGDLVPRHRRPGGSLSRQRAGVLDLQRAGGRQRWGAHNGCSPKPRRSQPDPGVTLTAYGDCASRLGGRALRHHR